jgi:hypothetical protein
MEPAKKERAHLVQVVGYDGTEPATRALNAAALWLQGVPRSPRGRVRGTHSSVRHGFCRRRRRCSGRV